LPTLLPVFTGVSSFVFRPGAEIGFPPLVEALALALAHTLVDEHDEVDGENSCFQRPWNEITINKQTIPTCTIMMTIMNAGNAPPGKKERRVTNYHSARETARPWLVGRCCLLTAPARPPFARQSRQPSREGWSRSGETKKMEDKSTTVQNSSKHVCE